MRGKRELSLHIGKKSLLMLTQLRTGDMHQTCLMTTSLMIQEPSQSVRNVAMEVSVTKVDADLIVSCVGDLKLLQDNNRV
ncbi:hypothetical protein DPMN_039061 [Dreissena polymorpha]|uniref:Uncharacterized protein n=1 Tax=Dreissena polymorpha TaxID=45954 RepID=A0A9D4MHJ2_DREPO|nr:hypothetical protein DPMN_039061 [Dreissena polymorpha]